MHAVRIGWSRHWRPRAIASVIAGIVLGLVAVVPASAQTTPLQLKVLSGIDRVRDSVESNGTIHSTETLV